MKKILIICPVTIPLNSGAGKNAFNTARKLKRDHMIFSDILTFRNTPSLKAHEIIEDVQIYRKKLIGNTPFLRRLSIFYLLPFLVARIKNYDAILMYGFTTGIFTSVVLSRLFKRKFIYRPTMYGSDDIYFLCSKFKLLKWYRRFIFKNIDYQLAIQPMIHESYLKVFGNSRKSIISPQGVDDKVFSPHPCRQSLRKELEIPIGKKVIISVGFLIKRKGYPEIFDALNLVQRNGKDFIYYVVGDYCLSDINSNYYEGLNKEMDDLYKVGTKTLGDSIVFLGRLSQSEVYRYLAASDIFIIQSSKEGLPNALLEAMAVGLAPIVSEIPGLEGFLLEDKKNCLITRGSDRFQLSEQISLLLDNSQTIKKIGDSARKTVSSQFTIDRYLKNIGQILDQI